MVEKVRSYPARLDIVYSPRSNRLTTFFRLVLIVPIIGILMILLGATGSSYVNEAGQQMSSGGGDILTALFIVTVLMILFRQRYPKWWFDFGLELNRFATRVTAYLLLLTDAYPSTVDKQSVILDIDYPDAKKDLNRWLPLVKWLLAFPHFVVLAFLFIGMFGATIIAWFAVLVTGRYPKSIFDFVVGVNRWDLRVNAYALLLVTDKYPPFSLK
ncbi:DUF4389 domain-containing protein [Candidatus Saccharibacteria bacterium]|nr:DUF4389 domain-containing protein [Candidatus Saccharibacteria bacterium]